MRRFDECLIAQNFDANLPKKYEIAQSFDAILPKYHEIARNFDTLKPSGGATAPRTPHLLRHWLYQTSKKAPPFAKSWLRDCKQ